MSFRIPHLLNTLSPNVPQHPPPQGVMHKFQFFTHASSHLRKLVLHVFLVFLSIFLSTFAISGFFQILCATLATVMISTFQVSIPSKAFMVFISLLLARSRYFLDTFVSCYDESVRRAFLRQFLFSATIGHFLFFLIDVIAGTITALSIRIVHLLRELYQVVQKFETCLSNGKIWDQTEIKARLDACQERNNSFSETETVKMVVKVIGYAISASVAPLLLVSRYARATGTGELEKTRDIGISLKWAATTGMGLFLSTTVSSWLWWYPLDTQQRTSSKFDWKTTIIRILQVVRLGSVQAGEFLYIGGMKAGVNSCFKCMSWIRVVWYFFNFNMIRGFLNVAQKNLLKDEKMTYATRVLLFIASCTSFIVDVVFLVNVYFTLVS